MNCVNEVGECNKSGVFEVFLMTKKNVIEISVISNESKEELYSHLISSGFNEKAFDIVVNSNGIKPCADIYARPGDRVYQWSKDGKDRNSSIATITCNAMKGTTKGFITVLHTLWHVSTPNLPLGAYEQSCGTDVYDYTWGRNTDSLFVPLSSGYSGVTGLIDNSNLYGNTKYQIASYVTSSNDYNELVGMPVKIFGKTTGLITGEVISLEGNINYNGLSDYTSEYRGTINNCVRVQLDSPNNNLEGNSGGPVCYDTGNTINSIPQLKLYAMFASFSDDGKYVSCPRISNIISELGLTSISTGTN